MKSRGLQGVAGLVVTLRGLPVCCASPTPDVWSSKKMARRIKRRFILTSLRGGSGDLRAECPVADESYHKHLAICRAGSQRAGALEVCPEGDRPARRPGGRND